MTPQNTRILFADDVNRFSEELSQLYNHFGGTNVDAVCAIRNAKEIFQQNRYGVIVIDPINFTKKLPEMRELVKLARANSDYLILAQGGFYVEQLGFQEGKNYDLTHDKPYRINELISKMERLMQIG